MTDPIIHPLLALAGTASDAPSATCDTPEAWLAAAADRPAWECWGKGRPSGACPAHPVLCHMLDVAAVAALLLTRFAPAALRKRLLGLHPAGHDEALPLLLFVVASHDLGKFTPAFQAMLPWAKTLLPARGFDLAAPDDARHHGDAGLPFARDALRGLGLSRSAATALARAVTAHHGEFPTDKQLNQKPFSTQECGQKPRWQQARDGAIAELRTFFKVASVSTVHIDHPWIMELAGLTAVADWIGSMDEVFVYEPPQPSLAAYWPRALDRAAQALDRVGMRGNAPPKAQNFAQLFPKFSPWPLHQLADTLATNLDAPALIVVEAPMGEGKTEAALLLAHAAAARLGQQGLYIGLPTKATANQMFGRVLGFLQRTYPDTPSNLILAHGDASLDARFRGIKAVYDPNSTTASGVRAEGWFVSKKRTLLADFAVGTIDQALLGVMRTQHGFVRLYGLAGKTVVLDEVHAYDTYTSTLLDRLVEWLASLGATVLLLSATLPSARRDALLKAYRVGCNAEPAPPTPPAPYPRVTVASATTAMATPFKPRGKPVVVALERAPEDPVLLAETIAAAVKEGGCIGWICNTVDRAQTAYTALRALIPDVPLLLIHARMIPEERAAREKLLESWLGPEDDTRTRPLRCVVIGTQVLEQSLDVDFDLLVTDLAPVDLVLQRAGRLHRHRRNNRSPAHPTPRLVLVHPEGGYATVDVRSVAMVYAEVLVRETLRVLEGRQSLTLPDDIEPLVEAVYHSGIPVEDDVLYGPHIEHFGAAIVKKQNAGNRLIPRPHHPDDIFGDLAVSLDDDENPALHKLLRAVTRDGEESVQVVCLVARPDGLYVSETDTTPFDLNAPPDFVLASRLARRTINISHASVVRHLLHDPSALPKAWGESALLRYRRAVPFTHGVAVVGDFRLTLDPDLGLTLKKSSPPSTP